MLSVLVLYLPKRNVYLCWGVLDITLTNTISPHTAATLPDSVTIKRLLSFVIDAYYDYELFFEGKISGW